MLTWKRAFNLNCDFPWTPTKALPGFCHLSLKTKMVNTGQASKGCTTCRRRRIRCDGTRPVCQRCVKSNRICLGYTATQGQPRPLISQDVSNFTDITTDDSQTSVLPPGCSPDVLVDPPPSPELEKLAKSVFEVITDGLFTLQRQAQIREERRLLFAKYGEATRQLRKALDSHSVSKPIILPVHLFSLYEVPKPLVLHFWTKLNLCNR